MQSISIAAITLQPAWDLVPPQQQAVSEVDPHPSALVHAEMADLLVNTLLQRNLIK